MREHRTDISIQYDTQTSFQKYFIVLFNRSNLAQPKHGLDFMKA